MLRAYNSTLLNGQTGYTILVIATAHIPLRAVEIWEIERWTADNNLSMNLSRVIMAYILCVALRNRPDLLLPLPSTCSVLRIDSVKALHISFIYSILHLSANKALVIGSKHACVLGVLANCFK